MLIAYPESSSLMSAVPDAAILVPCEQQQEQLTKLRKHLDEEVSHHEHEIARHQEAINRHKGRIDKLKEQQKKQE